MNRYEFEIERLRTRLREEMLRYLREADPDYTEAEVNVCFQILDRYQTEMRQAPDRATGMRSVQRAVEALNDLAERAEDLIETEQREDLCEIIILASAERRFNDPQVDITEPWRDW